MDGNKHEVCSTPEGVPARQAVRTDPALERGYPGHQHKHQRHAVAGEHAADMREQRHVELHRSRSSAHGESRGSKRSRGDQRNERTGSYREVSFGPRLDAWPDSGHSSGAYRRS